MRILVDSFAFPAVFDADLAEQDFELTPALIREVVSIHKSIMSQVSYGI